MTAVALLRSFILAVLFIALLQALWRLYRQDEKRFYRIKPV